MRAMTIWPGSPSPLGATLNGSGVNFALFSRCAAREDQSGHGTFASRVSFDKSINSIELMAKPTSAS
jgi:hypothetical protein